MTARLEQWTLDVRDVAAMARFWAAVLGYRIGDDGQHLWPPPDAGPSAPSVWLQPVAEPQRVLRSPGRVRARPGRPQDPLTPGKNRGHPDLVPLDGDVDAEVERLLRLGARHAEVGQSGEEGFVVLADPEGNEFCVLRRRRPDG